LYNDGNTLDILVECLAEKDNNKPTPVKPLPFQLQIKKQNSNQSENYVSQDILMAPFVKKTINKP
jgi:hypothetical protein